MSRAEDWAEGCEMRTDEGLHGARRPHSGGCPQAQANNERAGIKAFHGPNSSILSKIRPGVCKYAVAHNMRTIQQTISLYRGGIVVG